MNKSLRIFILLCVCMCAQSLSYTSQRSGFLGCLTVRWGMGGGSSHVSLIEKSISNLDQFSSVQSVVSNSLWPHELQHARCSCPSPTPRVYSNSSPSSWWCHPTISSQPSHLVPLSSCLQSFPASGSFLMSHFFAWGGQSIGVSASASVLPVNIQDWFPLGRTSWISLQSKRLSRVFSNTTVQKRQFFSAQLSLKFNSHPYMTTGKKP